MTAPLYKTAVLNGGPHVGKRIPCLETTPPITIKMDQPPQSTYKRRTTTGWDYDWVSTP